MHAISVKKQYLEMMFIRKFVISRHLAITSLFLSEEAINKRTRQGITTPLISK